MKKKFLIIWWFSVLLFTGCKDLLNKESYTDYDEEYTTKTFDGVKSLLNGIYDKMSGSDYYGRLIYAYEGSKGPDFFVRVNSGGAFERENRYAESTTSSGSADAGWTQIYSGIRNATILLENIDQVKDGSSVELSKIKGEAIGLRALSYFDLMRLFAYPPLYSVPGQTNYDEKYKWGVPIIRDVETGTDIYEKTILRETAEDCFSYIESELLQAKDLLANSEAEDGHINYTAVCALLTRLYLYENRWQDVVNMGTEALRIADTKYSLIPYENYKTTYYKPFNSENIWELVYSVTDNLGSNSLNYLVRKPTYNNPDQENDGEVSQSVGYAAYGLSSSGIAYLSDVVNNVLDVRGYLKCQLGVLGNDYTGFRKYVGEPYHFVHNIPIVRLPEIYLSLAEAYARLDDVTNAETYFNKTRMARVKTSGFSLTSQAGRINNVLWERRRELMLEGHTYWDFFRTGRTISRQIIENSNKSTIEFGNRTQVVYPIPLDELEANEDIRAQQNPGYESYDSVQ